MKDASLKEKNKNIYLITDAYRGNKIKDAIEDFLCTITGNHSEEIVIKHDSIELKIDVGEAQLVAYVGHNGLMDFKLERFYHGDSLKIPREAMVIACASKSYFAEIMETANAYPLLWVNDLLAPEAYILKSAIDGWIELESGEEIRVRAAKAYSKFQRCSLESAKKLFATGW